MIKQWLTGVMLLLSTASVASTQELFLMNGHYENSVLVLRSKTSDCSYVGEYQNGTVTLSKEVCENVERKIEESFKADEKTLEAGHVFSVTFKH
ncbi:hypothetical protein [Enterovibrio norvegicus]|uniref:DUF1496 domain-containing protein n=1 Tax=Enterovibrio norvegicus TaxID=188144 RepID=A0ABV4L6U9_9GAMM